MDQVLYCNRCKKHTQQTVFMTGTVCHECKGTNPIERREPDADACGGLVQRGTHQG